MPLSIKVAEAEVEEDVDKEDKTLYAATDIISVTHPILDSQGSHKQFPVNILLDTGSLGPNGNYRHEDKVNMIYPLHIIHKSQKFCL